MERIILVSGNWMFKNKRWLFGVDSKSGSRILQGNTKTTYDEFIDMVYEDYGLDKRAFNVELSYMLPKNLLQKLPPETPPVIIGNSRQFQFFLAQSKSETVRLCVEVKEKHLAESKENKVGDMSKNEEDAQVPYNTDRKRPRDAYTNDDNDNKVGDSSENEEDEYESRFDYCDDSDGTDSDDENFCKYGMPPEEKNDHANVATKKSNSSIYVNQPNEYLDNLELSSLNVAVGQCYATKEHLETRLKILTVLQKFDFRVDYSTPDLLIVK